MLLILIIFWKQQVLAAFLLCKTEMCFGLDCWVEKNCLSTCHEHQGKLKLIYK